MVANAYAQPAPTDPTITPPIAGPAEYATLLANSIRPFAAGSAARGTREGTSEGAATLYATVPAAPINPKMASSGSVSR